MRTLHIFDVSNYVYAGSYKNVNAVRGVRECDGMYEPNRAPIGGITYLADGIIDTWKGPDDYIVLAFDRKPIQKKEDYNNVFGHEKDYKGQRVPDFKIFCQKEYAEKFMSEIGIPCAFKDRYEADDIIYSMWTKYYNDFDYIRIHTEDSDLAFMVDIKTELLPVKKSSKRHITVENFDYAIKADKIIPYNLSILTKVVYGDTSDNIPGLRNKKLWLSLITQSMRELGITYPECGNIEVCRSILLHTIKNNPTLEDAHLALNILSLVTPYLINLEDVEEPTNNISIAKLRAISGMSRPLPDYPELENILLEYITEYSRA